MQITTAIKAAVKPVNVIPSARKANCGSIAGLFRRLTILLLYLVWALPAAGVEVATLLPGQPMLDVTEQAEVLHDPQGRYGIDDIASGRAGDFAHPGRVHSFGYIEGALWLRFQVLRAPDAEPEWWLEVGRPALDDVTLYAPQAGGGWRAELLGDKRPWQDRAIKSRASVFPLHPAAGETATYYLRVASTSAVGVWLQFWQPANYVRQSSLESFLLGGFSLALIVVVLFNLIYWYGMRERLHLLYGLYLLAGAGGLVIPEGILHQLADLSTPLRLEVAISLCQSFYFGLMALLFVNLVEIKSAGLRRFFIGLGLFFLLGQGLMELLGWGDAAKPWMLKLGLLALLMVLLTAATLAVRKNRMALFFAVAFFPVLLSSQQSILSALGLLEGLQRMNAMPMLGMLVHMVLMQLLVSSRIRKVRLEHAEYLARALDAERQSTERLAGEVEARTSELRETNASLLQTQARLQQALQQEQAALQQQKLFLGMIAHEFRNPLAVIDSATHLLDLRHPPGSMQGSVAARIRRGTHRLTLLLDNFLTRGRIESGGMAARPEPMQPQALATWAQETAELLSERHQFEISRTGTDEPFRADPQLVRVLVANLLSNAFKYAPAGSLVSMRIHRDEDGCRIEVRDQGPGIPAVERPRLFEAYRRGEDAGQQPGAGLGLFIVRSIAEMHGGRVELANGAEEGACFIVTLPSRNNLQ